MKKIFVFMLVCLFLVSSVSAVESSLGTFKQNDAITLRQMCASCSFNNISSVVYPNGTTAISNLAMTKSGAEFTYSLDKSYVNQLGVYYVNGYGDLLTVDTAWVYTFEVTENGSPNPDGITNVIYSILFFIVLAFSIVTLFNNLTSLAEVSFDIKDLTYSFIAFFGFLTYYYFANIYFNLGFVMGILDAMIWVIGFTHLFIPGIAFVITLIKTQGFTK